MDVETSGAIEQLGRRIDALEGSLRGEVGLLRGDVGSLRGEVGSLSSDVGSLRGEVGSLSSDVGSLRAEVGSLSSDVGSLRSELRAGLAETRRHSDVLFESLRDDIRMLAEGFATLTARLDSSRR
jgi:chromosome segregation ATPase